MTQKIIINQETDAVAVVDAENDFAHKDGTLYIKGGGTAVRRGVGVLKFFASDKRFASKDWHPPDHPSFEVYDAVHCVWNEWGSEFFSALDEGLITEIFYKGWDKNDELCALNAVSVDVLEGSLTSPEFLKTSGVLMSTRLKERGVKRLFVWGLATDYCILATVLKALKLGFEVYVLEDAIRAVNLQSSDDGEAAIKEMKAAGAVFVTSSQLVP